MKKDDLLRTVFMMLVPGNSSSVLQLRTSVCSVVRAERTELSVGGTVGPGGLGVVARAQFGVKTSGIRVITHYHFLL